MRVRSNSTAILLANIIGPGNGFETENVQVAEVVASEAPPITDVFINIIPSNPIQAMVEGEMLSIIFYAIVQGVATVFIANVYGIEPGIVGYATIIGMSVLASIGTAGVPGAGFTGGNASRTRARPSPSSRHDSHVH